jgi:hypothetical protein
MRNFIRKSNSFLKDLLLVSRLGILLMPFRFLFRFLFNFSMLSSWVNQHSRKLPFSDFYRPFRRYPDRLKLYEHVVQEFGLDQKPVQYLEFGVAGGTSFAWWVKANHHPDSRFHGFDTFEGLPEDWHFFKKGAFSFDIPFMDDPRGVFIKGLFQHTVFKFLGDWAAKTDQAAYTRVMHMDADLYSSTLFALTSLAPYLREGDIIFFDEFNIPNHEFAAWLDFTRSYYLHYEVLGAVNNFYQVAMKVTKSPISGTHSS